MKKVVLVTGAPGFLGGRICHALANQGYHVEVFVRKTSYISSLPQLSHGGVTGETLQLAYGDVTDYQSALEAFSGCYFIVHAAALVEPWLPDPSRFSVAVSVPRHQWHTRAKRLRRSSIITQEVWKKV